MQHIFHEGCHPGMKGWGALHLILHNVTCISRQYFVLWQLDDCLLAGDQDGKWEGELPNASNSCRSFALWYGMSAWPSIGRLTPNVLSTRSLNLAAMDMKLVAVNTNFGFSHSIWMQRPWQQIKQTTLSLS